MNKIGLNKKFRMGWNDYARLMSLKHFPSLSCDLSRTTTMLMLIMTLMSLTFNTTKSFADDLGTQYEVPNGIDNLVGIDPSDKYLSNTQTNMPTDPNKILYFYNVGAKSFLSPGAKWGTQASLDNTAHTLWLNGTKGSVIFKIVNNLGNSSTGTYLGFGEGGDASDLYMDRGAHNFVFEKAPDYKDNNKVYYVKTTKNGKDYYVQAYPEENKYCTFNEKQLTGADADYKNQEWKIITKSEYYTLVKANPANMEDVIDFSFIIHTPSFRIHDNGVSSWEATAETDKIFFGDNKQYKTYANRSSGTETWGDTSGGGKYNHDHQKDCGKLFYSYARGAKDFKFTQDIEVHKAGWYLLRCNGFTTQVNAEGNVSAYLMVAMVNKDGTLKDTKVYSVATLNKLSVADATKLMQNDATGTGAGRAFYDGNYENQVQVCLDEKELGTINNANPVKLRIGYFVDADCVLKDGDVTCVDNFKLLYGGPRRRTELILDEDQTSLLYLTNAKDSYKNSVLHLHRTLKEGQWNSLILPVKLNFGQMKRTFGDDVKVAKLTSLKDGVVIFRTVEPKIDSDVMVEAFEPYIIKPTSLTKELGLPYTAEKFYTSEDEDNNAFWLSEDCKSVSTSDDDRFSLTIPAGHYDITMVTLDRNELIKHLNLTEKEKTDYVENGNWVDVNWNNVNWKSNTSFSTDDNEGTLTCYGTLTKTYYKNDNGKNVIFDKCDKLSGDYIMRDGKIVQVPSTKEYGLKGFRCWFEVKNGSSLAKPLRLEIDGISDDATSIDEINSQPSQFTSRHKGISGVFNLDGQKVREGKSTQNLPKGIYIVNGRKVVVM